MASTFTNQQVELVDYDDTENVHQTVQGTGSKEVEKNKCRCKHLCYLACAFFLLVIILTIYFLYPKNVQICYKFDFGQDVATKLQGDIDEYDIKIKNSNYYTVELHDVRFYAYYGYRVPDDQLLSFEIGDWNIGPRTTSIRNESYVYTQNFLSVVPSTMLYACVMQRIDNLSFNVSVAMKGCILGTCRDIDNDELVYDRDCPSDYGWKCMDYTIKIF